MNRFSKAILIILAGLVLLAVAASIAANLYIQSPRTQSRIQDELGKALHVPLRITSTTVTPWGGMRMSGITVPGEDGTTIEANSFNAGYRLLPLLHGELVVDHMVLAGPKMVWTQSADGKWKLPSLPDVPKSPKSASGARDAKDKESNVTIGGLEITGGTIEMIDNQHQHFASATDVNMTYTVRHNEEVHGSFTASRLVWRESLFFTDVHSGVHYKEGKLAFSDLKGAIAAGSVTGDIVFQTDAPEDPFKSNLQFEKVDLERLTTEGNWLPGQSTGTLSGNLDLHGTTNAFDHSEGKGTLTLVNGQLRQFVYLQLIGQVLQIPELSDLHFSSAKANFRIQDQHTFIDHLQLDSAELEIAAKGNARFDGRLALDAQLTVSERLTKQLPELARGIILGNFTPPDDQGRRTIAFDISGRTDKPKTNLIDKIIGRRISSQLGDLVESIFGGKKKKKDKDKDREKDSEAKAAQPVPNTGAPAPKEP